MTEKRFTKCCPKIRDYGEEMSCTEVCDLLNKFHEENKQLGLEVSETNYEYNMLILKYQKLERENKELKELIKKTLETTPIEHNLAVELKNSVREL